MAAPFGESLALVLFGAGVALSIMEALAPGAHFVVLGVALIVAGLVGLLVPSIASPLVLAGLVLVTGAAALVVYRRLRFYEGTDSGRTTSSDALVGARGRVLDRVTPSDGRVKLERGGFDRTYAARTVVGEIPEGAEVIVIDPGGGNVLSVEPLDDVDEIERELAKGREAGRRTREPDGDAS